jgi:hypothetical protein
MNLRTAIGLFALSLVLGGGWTASPWAHQDPCQRWQACPSDARTYICGDLGCCEECPDNHYGLARRPRGALSQTPALPSSPSVPSESTTPAGVMGCFTPGGAYTDRIVKMLGGAKSSLMVQAYSFTSAPMAQARLDAHTRGV